MSTPRTDQDAPWKIILRNYFQEAIEFFFPDTARLIDWSRGIEFLDKELVQIAIEAKIGRRYADQLVKVWLKQGKEAILLIHAEIQAKPEANFGERMLVYNLRIFNLLHRPVVSLAILCDGDRRWRPNRYEFIAPDTQLTFTFGMVKLLDYQDHWDELEQNQNPFATVVMAHLKMMATKGKNKSQERKYWKFWLIRRLYEKGYNRERVLNLYRFIDWLIMLPKALNDEVWAELKAYEEENKVPYITSVEKIGFERGIAQGVQQGVQQGEQKLTILLLEQRLGQISPELREQIDGLSLPQLEALAIALFDITSIAELETWLSQK
jgi:Domain of unknown function (DUF4351)